LSSGHNNSDRDTSRKKEKHATRDIARNAVENCREKNALSDQYAGILVLNIGSQSNVEP
jgi:hypothetical protein